MNNYNYNYVDIRRQNEDEVKENNRNRFVYSFLFIIILVVISIMYASLAINFGVKVKTPKVLEPKEAPVEIKTEAKQNTPITPRVVTPRRVTPTPQTPTPPIVPVITPPDINWKIEFENVNIKSGSVRAVTEANILSSKTAIDYEVVFTEPGEFYSFDVYIVNKGNVDAKIYEIIETGMTERQKKFLDYSVVYADGNEIKVDDVLPANKKKKITISLSFKETVDPDDLPDYGQVLKLSYQLVYVEK